MKKTVEVEKFLRQHEDPAKGYRQFTIDWIEEAQDRIEDWQRRQPLPEADFLHALHYQVDSIREIMVAGLPDRKFFLETGLLLGRLAGNADAETRRERMVSKAALN